MAKLSVLAGATSQSFTIFIQDSSVTTGAGLTGLVYNTASLVAYYTFTGTNTAATAITLATLAASNSAYSSGGFKEIDATNMPGVYRLDIPNAALATAKGRSVVVMLKGAANMAPCVFEIELTGWDNQGVTIDSNMTKILGTAVSTPATAGILDVNLKNIANATVSSTTAQLGVNAVQISGDGTAADNAEAFFDGTGYAGTNNIIPTVTTVTNQLAGTAIADAVLDRNMATGTDSGGRTVRNALRFLRNKWSISGTTLTVTKEDDSTSAWTTELATAASDPVTGSDPA